VYLVFSKVKSEISLFCIW